MKISPDGIDFIKSFEGYLRELPNGDCTAYLDPVGVATIGWGCTEGIKLGMVWTREEAEECLAQELATFEAAVNRLVTVEINQHEFDALVSFSYNVGAAGLARSSVLRYLNKDKRERAADSFKLWNKGTIRGRKVVLRGLTRRRLAEAVMFLAPVPINDEIPEADVMVQKVEPSPAPVTPAQAATGATVGTVATGAVVQSALTSVPPPPPPTVTQTVENVSAWKGLGHTVSSFGSFAYDQPWLVGAIVVFVLVLVLGPRFLPEKWQIA